MKKLLGIVVLGLLLSGNAYTQETALICELKKYFSRKNLVSKQIETPLNQVDSIYISKQYLVLDFDKKEYIKSSSFIFPTDYQRYTFSDEAVYFVGHGPDTENYFHTSAVLNRYTGELEIKTQTSNAVAKRDPSQGGYRQLLIYECEKDKKKF